MKRIFGSLYFLHLFTNSTSQFHPVIALSLYECMLVCSVLWRVDVGTIYGSIAQNLKLDWSIQVTWKYRVIGNNICLSEHIDKHFSCYFFSSLWKQVKYIIIEVFLGIYSHSQKFFTIGFIKFFAKIIRKHVDWIYI